MGMRETGGKAGKHKMLVRAVVHGEVMEFQSVQRPDQPTGDWGLTIAGLLMLTGLLIFNHSATFIGVNRPPENEDVHHNKCQLELLYILADRLPRPGMGSPLDLTAHFCRIPRGPPG